MSVVNLTQNKFFTTSLPTPLRMHRTYTLYFDFRDRNSTSCFGVDPNTHCLKKNSQIQGFFFFFFFHAAPSPLVKPSLRARQDPGSSPSLRESARQPPLTRLSLRFCLILPLAKNMPEGGHLPFSLTCHLPIRQLSISQASACPSASSSRLPRWQWQAFRVRKANMHDSFPWHLHF